MSYCCLNEQKQVDKVVSKHPDDPGEVVTYVAPLQPVWDKVVQTASAGRFGWLQPVGGTANELKHQIRFCYMFYTKQSYGTFTNTYI